MSRNLKISGAIVLALVLGVAALAFTLDSPPDEREAVVAAAPDDGTPQVMPENMHKLSTAPDGKVTLVEFLDFECEACGAIYPHFERLREEYDGRVTFAIRYFPNDSHFNAMLSAQAVEAASKQGKLVEMYKRMFETQIEWGEARESKRELFLGFAEDLGLDMDRFVADLDDPLTVERVLGDKEAGLQLGVRGTPTIFINEQLIELTSLDQLKADIDAALAE